MGLSTDAAWDHSKGSTGNLTESLVKLTAIARGVFFWWFLVLMLEHIKGNHGQHPVPTGASRKCMCNAWRQKLLLLLFAHHYLAFIGIVPLEPKVPPWSDRPLFLLGSPFKVIEANGYHHFLWWWRKCMSIPFSWQLQDVILLKGGIPLLSSFTTCIILLTSIISPNGHLFFQPKNALPALAFPCRESTSWCLCLSLSSSTVPLLRWGKPH